MDASLGSTQSRWKSDSGELATGKNTPPTSNGKRYGNVIVTIERGHKAWMNAASAKCLMSENVYHS
jgi:predicted protein tyrosine phosphatase